LVLLQAEDVLVLYLQLLVCLNEFFSENRENFVLDFKFGNLILKQSQVTDPFAFCFKDGLVLTGEIR